MYMWMHERRCCLRVPGILELLLQLLELRSLLLMMRATNERRMPS